MNFTVTYRSASGARTVEVVEATSRADVFAQMQVRGIRPLSVVEGGKPTSGRKQSAASPSGHSNILRGLLAAVAVLVVAFAAWFFLSPEPAAPLPAPTPKKQAAPKPLPAAKPRPKPVAAQTNQVAEVAKPKEKTREERIKAIEDRYRGREDEMPPGTKQALYFLKNPPKRSFKVAGRTARMFKRNSDRAIASLLTAEPGTLFLEKPSYGESFLKDFRASLDEPIEISDDDSPEDVALKKAVQATREDFKARMADGEDICATMTAVATSMYEMGQLKGGIEEQLHKMRLDESYSDQDITDFVTAANKYLREKGIKEMPMPKLFLRRYSLKKAAERAARKAAEESKAAAQAN